MFLLFFVNASHELNSECPAFLSYISTHQAPKLTEEMWEPLLGVWFLVQSPLCPHITCTGCAHNEHHPSPHCWSVILLLFMSSGQLIIRLCSRNSPHLSVNWHCWIGGEGFKLLLSWSLINVPLILLIRSDDKLPGNDSFNKSVLKRY